MARHSEKVAPSAMAPLPRQSPRIRRRVAWMYYAEEMTQGPSPNGWALAG